MAAAAIYILVLVVMTVLTMVFGFGSLGFIFMGLSPLFFAASYPLYKFAESKQQRNPNPSAKTIARYEREQRILAQKIEASKKANRIFNAENRRRFALKDISQ